MPEEETPVDQLDFLSKREAIKKQINFENYFDDEEEGLLLEEQALAAVPQVATDSLPTKQYLDKTVVPTIYEAMKVLLIEKYHNIYTLIDPKTPSSSSPTTSWSTTPMPKNSSPRKRSDYIRNTHSLYNYITGMKSVKMPPIPAQKKITQKVDLTTKSSHRLSQTGQAILSRDLQDRVNLASQNPFLGMNIPDEGDKRTITEQYLKANSDHIYNVEEAEPPRDFASSMFHPLPNDIDFKRIIYNVMNALSVLHKEAEWVVETMDTNTFESNHAPPKKKSRYEKWLGFLMMRENIAVSSDSFWFIIAKLFKGESYKDIQENLLDRISKNYVNYYISIEEGIEKNEFFKYYFDILSQTVFYSIFYAFPKSRHKFNDELKRDLIAEFSYLFTGITITNYHRYIKNWCLDLGNGNIFKQGQERPEQEKAESLTQQQLKQQREEAKEKKKNNQSKLMMKYSPIMERYLLNYKYKTINFQKEFRMRFTYYDQNQLQQKDKFAGYMKKAKFIYEKMKLMQKHSVAKKQEIDLEIRQINQEAS